MAMTMPALRENVPLRDYTSFKVGGPARFFCEPTSQAELSAALCYARNESLPCTILGRGSNVVVSDHGLPGLVIRLGDLFGQVRVEKDKLYAEAGALLNTAVNKSIRAGLAGIQKLGGIPGTIGGGAFINAGAYGQELGQVITRVESLTRTGEERVRTHAECAFSYRYSLFCAMDEVITRVEMQLEAADTDALHDEMREMLRHRKEKQPLELPNAGSMFKRPPGHFAGALIEASGLKGHSIGGAQVSVKHAGFIVNTGGATAADIWELTERVIERVRRDHGVTLEREVIFLGEIP